MGLAPRRYKRISLSLAQRLPGLKDVDVLPVQDVELVRHGVVEVVASAAPCTVVPPPHLPETLELGRGGLFPIEVGAVTLEERFYRRRHDSSR
jgi:hypothetical protein